MVDFGELAGTSGMGSAFGVIDSGMNILTDWAKQAIQDKYWNKQYDKTRKDYLADRAHQEEYNSPAHQMELLAQAGLNPNLVYGKYQGAATSGTSSPANQSAKGTSPGGSTASIASNIAAINQMRQVELQGESIQAKANLDNAQANYYNSLTPKWSQQIDQQIAQSKKTIESITQDILVGKSKVDYNTAAAREKEALSILHDADTQYRNGQINKQQFEVKEIIARTVMYGEQSEVYKQQKYVYSEQSYNLGLEGELLEFKTDVNSILRTMGGLEKLADSQLEKIGYELSILAAEAGVKSNNVYQWVSAIAPIVFEVDSHANNWYNSFNKESNQGLSNKQLLKLGNYIIKNLKD